MDNIGPILNRIIKPEIKQLKRMKDTFDDRFDYVRLDKKERLIDFEAKLFNEFKNNLKSVDLSGYHEIGSTYRKLAKFIGVTPEEILLAAGSDLAIKSIYEACFKSGDHIVLHSPSYAMFKVYASMFGIDVSTVPVKDNWSLDIEGMLKSVNDKTKMLVIENPNGFVGTKPSAKNLERIAAYLFERQTIFLVDEAYYYVEESQSRTHQLIKKYPNVIVSQTFSKGHGLAGARFGYLIGHPELIEHVSRVRPMHEIASLTAIAAEWILDHPKLLEENQKAIKESKDIVFEGLKRFGVNAKNTHANFILAYFPDEGTTSGITKKLKEKKILIRRPFEESYLKGWALVCVGSSKTSKQFVDAVGTILGAKVSPVR